MTKNFQNYDSIGFAIIKTKAIYDDSLSSKTEKETFFFYMSLLFKK